MRVHVALAVALAMAVSAACASRVDPPRAASAVAAQLPASNILRHDYVGSAECKSCHGKEFAAWTGSPMHRMTRTIEGAEVRAPFDGRAMHFKGESVSLREHEGQRFVRIDRGAGSTGEVYRVTRVIGGRTREDFVGVRVRDTSDVRPVSEERVLPVSYLIFAGTLRYKGYSVLVHERQSAQSGPTWSETCVFCHNTVPFFSTLYGALSGPRAPAYQGEDVDPLLPPERRWTFRVADSNALHGAIDAELEHLHAAHAEGNDAQVLRTAIATTRAAFGPPDFVEMGIGCEACHNGGRVHVADTRTPPRYAPYAPLLSIEKTAARTPDAERAQAINRVCVRCHQVLFSRYPWTWEGGRRQSADRGGSSMNSGEGRDFLLGGCASELACTKCHDPHDGRLTPSVNGVCTGCHTKYAGDEPLRAHAHHDPRGAGGSCVACHMARKNVGLDLRLTAYHRIGSPTDPARVLRDRPLECAVCHADKSVESLVGSMETWWKKAYPRDELTGLYGDLNAPVLDATIDRGKPHEVAVAAALLGATHHKRDAPQIAKALANEYPLIRMIAARALDDALGEKCGLDVNGESVAAVEARAAACLAGKNLAPPVWSKAPMGVTGDVPAED